MPATGQRFERRLTTILVMIGVAVGLGNVWRFPYMMGSYGGGAFLVLYLLALLLFGVPALIAEWVLGRATRQGPPGAFVASGMPAGRLAGWTVFVIVGMATSYYVVVIGWVVVYFVIAATGGLEPSSAHELFERTLANLPAQVLAAWSVLVACGIVALAGVRGGIERVSRLFVPIFFLLVIGLTVRGLSLPGAWEGVRWLLTFDPGAVTATTLLAVIGQAAFSLALGGTFMVAYGAYLDPDIELPRLAVQTALGDLAASLLAALLVIPAVFAAGLEPTTGPPLLFHTLPSVFAGLPGGGALATLFFLALGLVAFLSAVAAVEVLVAPLVGWLGWPRKRAVWTVVGVEAVLGLPAMMSLEYLETSDLIWGSTGQPFGSLMAVLAVGWALDRGRALQESGLAPGVVGRLWIAWLRFVVPLAVMFALVGGWLES